MTMTRILVPYHLDEHLPDLDVPVDTQTTVWAAVPPSGPGPTWRLPWPVGIDPLAVAAAVAEDRGHV